MDAPASEDTNAGSCTSSGSHFLQCHLTAGGQRCDCNLQRQATGEDQDAQLEEGHMPPNIHRLTVETFWETSHSPPGVHFSLSLGLASPQYIQGELSCWVPRCRDI